MNYSTMQLYGQSYGARFSHLSWLMRLSEGVRVCSPVGVIESLTSSWRTTGNNVFISKRLIPFKEQLGSTYGGDSVREVSRGYAALWLVF